MQECPSFALRASQTGAETTLPHNCPAATKNSGRAAGVGAQGHAYVRVARGQGAYRAEQGQAKRSTSTARVNAPSEEREPMEFLDEAAVISVYTRAQAIDDGVLVDVTETAREAGLRMPTAVTRAVWDRYVTVPPGVQGQDEAGRLWDVVWMARFGIAQQPDRAAHEALFQLHVRNTNRAGAFGLAPLVTLKIHCGPGDQAEPVLTIMLPEED